MMNRLDHVVIAAPDLDAAKADFEERTGVLPADGGPHLGLGTRNALVAFDGGVSYLEIVAPDPAQPQTGTFGSILADLPTPTILHWAIRVDGLAAVAEHARAVGLEPGPIRPTAREAPDGRRLEWELMGIGGHGLRGLAPFYIDWLDCTHPALTTPVVGPLRRFEVDLPAGSPVAQLLDPAPAETTIGDADCEGGAGLTLVFDSPRQRVELTSSQPRGFSL